MTPQPHQPPPHQQASQEARVSRQAQLAQAARIIDRGCHLGYYSDQKERRLLWETTFFIFEGQFVPFMPPPQKG